MNVRVIVSQRSSVCPWKVTQCININAFTVRRTPKKINFVFAFNAWGYQRIESNYLLYIYFCFATLRSERCALELCMRQRWIRVRLAISFSPFIHVLFSFFLSHPENSIRFHAFSGSPIKYTAAAPFHAITYSQIQMPPLVSFACSFFALFSR